MFRSVVMIFAVLLLAMPAFAGDLQAGVKGGVNLATTRGDDALPEADSRLGMALGGYVSMPMTPMFSIQPEALFTMKGFETPDAPSSSFKINYVEIPVLAKLSLAPEAVAHPSVFVGPSLGLNVSSKVSTDGQGEDVDMKDMTKSTEFGLVMGGGLDMPIGPMGKQSIGLDVRYNLGLNSIDESGSDANVKNGVLSILGTFRFL